MNITYPIAIILVST